MGKFYVFNVCVFVHNVLHGQFPSWLITLPFISDINGPRTRQANDLFVPRRKTDTGARALDVRGPTLWNKLPREIRDVNSRLTFKKKLKDYLNQS